jgi:cysteine desulfurase
MTIYFDNAATTPLHPQVFEKMKPFLTEYYGNASSIHSFGRKARVAVETAREIVAEFINANTSEIYFTSGGTEANNFSLFGIAKAEKIESKRNHIITSSAEHHSVLDACNELQKNGFDITKENVDSDTRINPEEFIYSINQSTSLVSIIHTNNETGSVNQIEKISQIVKAKGIFLHTDAVQCFGKATINVNELGVDSLSASAHKINGPKGTGFSFVKSGTPITPLLIGGSQERNRRGGTENVAGIAGLAEAINIAKGKMKEAESHVLNIKEKFLSGLLLIDSSGIKINGGNNVSPYILSVTFKPDYYKSDSEAMMMFLDINGVAASNGAACTSGTLKPSHVILNSGGSIEDANGTIRFSFGIQNNESDVEYALDVIQKMAIKFRR